MNGIERARKVSVMSQTKAGKIIGCSVPTYAKKEKQPGLFTVDEILLLYGSMDEISRGILWSEIDSRRQKILDCNCK